MAPLIHTSITSYHVQLLNGSPLRAEVDAGRTIMLNIDNQQYELALEPKKSLFDPTYAETLPEEVRDLVFYKGIVVGMSDSSVSLSLRLNVVRGSIRTGSVRWYIEPLTNFGDPASVDAPVNTHIIYRASDVVMNVVCGNDDNASKII